MAISTVTDKGQTTVPQEIRDALKVKPRQRLTWSLNDDGSANVRPQPSALDLFGSLKTHKKFPGRATERESAARAAAQTSGTGPNCTGTDRIARLLREELALNLKPSPG